MNWLAPNGTFNVKNKVFSPEEAEASVYPNNYTE